MRLILLILFIAMPLLEIAVFIQLGDAIGLWMTIFIVVATAIIGTTVLHSQGFAVLQRANASMRQGAPPIEPIMEGVLLLVAGAFLLTPGLITDSIGGLLLIPPLRQLFARGIIKRAAGGLFGATIYQENGEPDEFHSRPRRDASTSDETVIEGEFTRVDEHTINPHRRNNR
ncbi:MAG: FxsA family protein [Hyphomicrobiaceae bacterium]